MIIKNQTQLPASQLSIIEPDEEARIVLPAVPIDANRAYWVAVYLLSTNKEIKATKAMVAKAVARSSNRTDTAKSTSSFPTQASKENNKFVEAIAMPEINNARIIPPFITKKLPNRVNRTVVIQPTLFEYTAISDFEKPISL